MQGHIPVTGNVEFVVGLATQARDWALSILQVGPIRKLDHFDICAAELVDVSRLKEEMRREADAKVAMRALKRLTEKKKKTDPGGRQSKRKAVREGGKANKAGKKHLEEEGGFGGGSANGSSQSCSIDDTDSESEVAAATGHVPPPDAPADMPAPADRPAKRVRQNQRRGQVWGTCPAFQLAPIHAAGSAVATGWGAICSRHSDPDRPSLQCKKAMSKTGLNDEECQLRLKRWLVCGMDDSGWGSNKRECHVSMGGIQLSQFAEGLGHADLDAAVGHQT